MALSGISDVISLPDIDERLRNRRTSSERRQIRHEKMKQKFKRAL